jgi:flagellar hook-basal body complex protein FliE
MNSIANITPLNLPQLTPTGTSGIAGAGQPGEFQKVLSGAINQVESMNNNATQSVQKFLSGDNEDLHTTILATQKAELAFQLSLQVRNKVVDAYQEIMKMQM